MEKISPILDTLAIIIDIFSVIVITYGVILCAKDFIVTRFTSKDSKDSFIATTVIKNQLASYILLSLEILIAADIIETIVSPTLTDIALLAATVVIRTVISYFLNKEIKESNLKEDLD
ncbi:DUF1622 domain-containing protein [Breznakia pachnodae]|uniref:Membrane protein n=1 Tax=Breznakia pachnodae TaxID=265178 RepID=A0ABU0E1R5_9FIRM|nr:DUF1622 domain-containing protein [Breznakia pachnodae]MDQ0360823.1 putative membrane protein [Breznakia pachnodae]